jgi:DeoR/GlpR family transcriptional regulator of sugar metabolism
VQALRTLHLDAVFLGVHGIDLRAGFTTPNLSESETNRAFVEAAGSLVVVADHTKWGIVGLSTIAGLAEADALVTDDGLAEDARQALGEQVRDLLVAPTRRKREEPA